MSKSKEDQTMGGDSSTMEIRQPIPSIVCCRPTPTARWKNDIVASDAFFQWQGGISHDVEIIP